VENRVETRADHLIVTLAQTVPLAANDEITITVRA
jgi:hypothetical protein